MIPALTGAIVVLAVVVVVLTLVAVVRDREPDWFLAGFLAGLELALVAQCATGLVKLATEDRDVNGAVFAAYLVGALLVPPIGFVWAATERTRWGTAVIGVAGLVVVALEFRLDQIWGG